MKFFNDDKKRKQENYPKIEEISVDMPAVSEFCSLTRLPDLFHEADTDTLPVIDIQGKIAGIVSEFDLAQVVPQLSENENSYQCKLTVYDIMTSEVWTEEPNTNVKKLFDKINTMHTRVIPIVDKDNYYSGTAITRSSIIKYLTRLIKPNSLGGLATPLGVYITDGKHQAGVGNLGLFLTGISVGAILVFVEHFFNFIFDYLNINSTNAAVYPIIFILQIITFIFLLRITPLTQIHAAEHQTINAIEKGLPLTLDTVKMQPREHVRCGTNLMILFIGLQMVILIFAGYFSKYEPLIQFIFLFTGFMFVFSNWKKWGIWLQKYLTTAKAPNKYILSGIKAGEEILHKHKEDLEAKPPTFFRKIWCMAIIQIICGFIFTQWLTSIFLKIVF